MPLVTSMPPLDDRRNQARAARRARPTSSTTSAIDRAEAQGGQGAGRRPVLLRQRARQLQPQPGGHGRGRLRRRRSTCAPPWRPTTTPATRTRTASATRATSAPASSRPSTTRTPRPRARRCGCMVRNIPVQDDFDQDGIGDVCDNCIVRPTAATSGPRPMACSPAGIGRRCPFDEDDVCQVDNDMAAVRRRCLRRSRACRSSSPTRPVRSVTATPMTSTRTAWRTSTTSARAPLGRVEDGYAIWRRSRDECPTGAKCTNGVCNHVDSDNDNVGDRCDTCPYNGNSKQVLDGGMQDGRPGRGLRRQPCETNTAATSATTPRQIAFYDKVQQRPVLRDDCSRGGRAHSTRVTSRSTR
jgi:hypothetical protein